MADLHQHDETNETGFGTGVILSIVMAIVIFGILLLSHRG